MVFFLMPQRHEKPRARREYQRLCRQLSSNQTGKLGALSNEIQQRRLPTRILPKQHVELRPKVKFRSGFHVTESMDLEPGQLHHGCAWARLCLKQGTEATLGKFPAN